MIRFKSARWAALAVAAAFVMSGPVAAAPTKSSLPLVSSSHGKATGLLASLLKGKGHKGKGDKGGKGKGHKPPMCRHH